MTTRIPDGGFTPLPACFAEMPLGDVYRLIEPGPVVLLTTALGADANVMTMSWHMMVDFEPPLVACIVAGGDFSSQALERTGECVIALPDVAMARAVVGIGNTSGRRIDKFAEFGLTPARASTVAAPLIAECFAGFECRVIDTTLAETYGLRILQVVRAWRDTTRPNPKTIHHQGYGDFAVDGRRLHLPSKMP